MEQRASNQIWAFDAAQQRRLARRQQLLPWNGLNLKGNLKHVYNSIIHQWRIASDEREEAPNVVHRVKWQIIKYNLQDVHWKLRRLQRPSDQRYFHASRGFFEPVEHLFDKFCDIWNNYLHIDDLVIEENDEQWIDLWIAMGELRASIYSLNTDLEILEV